MTSKSNLKQWENFNRKGELYSFTFCDSSGSIDVVNIGKDLKEAYESTVVGECYEIAGFEVKKTNPQYGSSEHDYEVHLSKVKNFSHFSLSLHVT